jgi:hypothetical protein
MVHELASMVSCGSEFYVLPRTFGAAKIPVKFGLRLKEDELLTYEMVRPVGFRCVCSPFSRF